MHVCVYTAPFGVVPLELDEVYPLSQHETVLPLDLETIDYVANQTAEYIGHNDYESILLLNDKKLWGDKVKHACMKACRKKSVTLDSVDANIEGTKETMSRIENIIRNRLVVI